MQGKTIEKPTNKQTKEKEMSTQQTKHTKTKNTHKTNKQKMDYIEENGTQKINWSSLSPEHRHVLSEVFEFANPDLSLSFIRSRVHDLSKISFLTLVQEAFSQTLLSKATASEQLCALISVLSGSHYTTLAKQWLVGEVTEIQKSNIDLFFTSAKKGFKRVFVSIDKEQNSTALHLVYIEIRPIPTGLLGSIASFLSGSVKTEYAKMEFINLTAILMPGALKRKPQDVLFEI